MFSLIRFKYSLGIGERLEPESHWLKMSRPMFSGVEMFSASRRCNHSSS